MMAYLLLQRREDERTALVLEDGRILWVTLRNVRRGRASLGIEAPPSVRVFREEVLPDDLQGGQPCAR